MFCFRAFFRACLLLAFAYTGVVQAASTFNLATGTGGGTATEYTWASPVLTVNNGADITITGTASGSTRIVVASGATANITLNGVSIDVSAIANTAAFDMTGATVNLTLQGSNTLKSGADRAGLEAPSGATLDIFGSGGSLVATGGFLGAGIGGGNWGDGGTITIHSGTVNVMGGNWGAGIGGGGNGGAGGNISIHGGTVTAMGGSLGGAGIGGGWNGSGGNITIDDGTIMATGGAGGAGIGGGWGSPNDGGASGTITITGNAGVIATGGNNNAGVGGGAGIGSGGSAGTGFFGAVNTITISTTGPISATGGTGNSNSNGANIGQGGKGSGDGAGITSWTSPTAQTVVAGNTATFSVTTTPAAGTPLPSLAYQWQESTDGGATFGVVGGATLASYTTIPTTMAMSGHQYRSVLTASNVNGNSTGTITITGMSAALTVVARNAAASIPTTGGGMLIALGVLLALVGIGYQRSGIRKS